MKKQSSLLLLALFAALVLPAVFAEDENSTPTPTATPEITPAPEQTPEITPEPTGMPDSETDPETGEQIVDEETAQEIKAMESGYGAQVRLLQLDKAILRGIKKGEAIIAFIKEKFPEKDASGLEAILVELKALKDEVNVEYEAVKANGVDEDTVKTFVDLKKDARSLAKQFRTETNKLLKGSEKQGLAQYLKEAGTEEAGAEEKELNAKIKATAQQFNAKRLEDFFSKLEEKAPDLIAKVKSGELTLAEAKAQLKEILKELGPVPKGNAFQWMKELASKARVFGQARALEAKKNFLERRVNRLQERIEQIKNNPKPSEVAQRIMDRVKERIQNRIMDQNLQSNGTPARQGRR